MKKSILLPLLIFMAVANARETDKSIWHTDISSAIAEAKIDNRPILIYFSGSDWCKPCIQLSRNVLETPAFKQFAQHELILVRSDFPRMKKNQLSENQVRKNEHLAERYNPNGVFPFLVIINKDQEIIKQLTYHQEAAEDYINIIKNSISL